MLTKGIIVEVEDLKNVKGSNYNSEEASNVFYYKVRIPILHGYSENDSGACPDKALPDSCIYAGLPGEQTMLHKGDIVLVELSDYNPQWPVILGLMPHVSDDMNGKGADKTSSGLSIKNVQNITFDTDNGRAFLPKNTNIQTDDNYYGRDHVVGEELSQLKGVTSPIQLQLNDLSQSITSVLSSLSSAEVWVNSNLTISHTISVSSPKSVGNVQYNKKLDNTRAALWLNNSHKNVLDFNYILKYIGDDEWVYPSTNPTQTITKSDLATWGIEYSQIPSINDLLYVAITIGVISIEMGGTGASNTIKARENLEIFKDVLISEAEFDALQDSDYQTNTIYYIYEET